MFEVVRFCYKGELLPSTDPESMRVKIIANNIIDALKRGLNKENVRSEALLRALTKKKGNCHLKSQPYMSHVDGLNWEILVAKGPVKAFCLPGKIVVFTGMMEIEADYIGLILLASAGYDPRAAPKLYKKFQRITGDSTIFSTHPSGNKRAEFLAQTQKFLPIGPLMSNDNNNGKKTQLA
ncbi:mitochondrial metalloendopeptidase OMA1 [Trifolium pratense]|uniref:Mitochondrial metalloendopeptidase OMA1 n=1 Tax=Trifolium pratense TaxID=57577 RepID=A0A2K3P3I8_TRIPR|nr:mitochondrial metalloendopeptidase OMA1 [Trifolium pratense]